MLSLSGLTCEAQGLFTVTCNLNIFLMDGDTLKNRCNKIIHLKIFFEMRCEILDLRLGQKAEHLKKITLKTD